MNRNHNSEQEKKIHSAKNEKITIFNHYHSSFADNPHNNKWTSKKHFPWIIVFHLSFYFLYII